MARDITIKTKFSITKGNGESGLDSTIITGLTGSRMTNEQTVVTGSWQQVFTGSCQYPKWIAIENTLTPATASKLFVNRNNTGEPFAVLEPGDCCLFPVTSSTLYVTANTSASIPMWVVIAEK